ncbi:acyltransferase family protein [Comamonas piscis]
MALRQSNNSNMLYSIQALRGLGAIAVVIFHALAIDPIINFQAGAAGVDLFFIISGIVMTMSVKDGTNPTTFFLRRVARVVPLYWIMTGLAILHLYVFYPGAGVSLEAIVRSIFFLRPENGSMPILYPGWSLNFEMLFYLTLTIFLILSKNSLILLMLFFLCLGALSSIEYFKEFYFIKYYLLEFSIGIGIGFIFKLKLPMEKMLGFFCITASILLFAVNNHFRSVGFIAWGIPSALLILGCYSFDSSVIFKNKFIKYLGDSSYSIYLVHPFVIWAFERTGHKGAITIILAILLSAFAGVICYRYVEKPLLSLSLKYINNK